MWRLIFTACTLMISHNNPIFGRRILTSNLQNVHIPGNTMDTGQTNVNCTRGKKFYSGVGQVEFPVKNFV